MNGEGRSPIPFLVLAACGDGHKKVCCMSSRSTVFLVPGLTGTQLRDCVTGQLLWLSPELMLDCPASLMEYLDLHYDTETKSFTSIRGVAAGGDIGDLKSIKMVTEPPMCAGGQFDQFVKFLVAIGGYTEGKDLFGAPYDWRLILDSTYWKSFSEAFRLSIEQNTGGCSNTRASLVGFSLGGLVITRFLREQSLDWRARYIQRVILVGAPLGGCPRSFISICGVIEDVPGYDTPCVRRFLQKCSGAFMCHPIPACFPDLAVIRNLLNPETKEVRSFQVTELAEAYRHPKFRTKSALNIYTDYSEFINSLMCEGIAEDVELHIVYSSVRDTTIALDYQGGLHGHKIRETDYYRQRRRKAGRKCDTKPYIVGDGMIPHISLAYWDNKCYSSTGKPYATSIKQFTGYQYEHADLFNRVEIISYVYELLDVSCLDQHLKPLLTPHSLLT